MNGLTVCSVKKEIIACWHATTDLMTINDPTTARSCLVTMPGSSFFGFKVRGVQVMLDFDLAEIYGYTTKAFNQQVRNNIQKFDDDFRFQLTREEQALGYWCCGKTLKTWLRISQSIPKMFSKAMGQTVFLSFSKFHRMKFL